MPRIPTFQSSRAPNLTVGVPAEAPKDVNFLDAASKFGEQITKLSLAVHRQRTDAEAISYANKQYTNDLVEFNDWNIKQQTTMPDDPTGYTQIVSDYFDNKMSMARDSAPSDKAFRQYSEKLNRLKQYQVTKANGYENSLKLDNGRRNIKDSANIFASQMALNPDAEQAVEYIEELDMSIDFMEGTLFTPSEADKIRLDARKNIIKRLIEGHLRSDNPERALNVLKFSIGEKDFQDILIENGVDNHVITEKENARITKIFGTSLSASEKSVLFGQTLDRLKSKNTQVKISQSRELSDLSASYQKHGNNDALDKQRDDLLNKIYSNPSYSVQDKIRATDDLNLASALGNIGKDLSNVPLSKRASAKTGDKYLSEARAKTAQNIEELKNYNVDKNEYEKEAKSAQSPIFNSSNYLKQQKQINASIQKDSASLLKDSAAYAWINNDKIKAYGSQALDSSRTPAERSLFFDAYTKELDSYYDYLEVPAENRKYLTTPLSSAYASFITDPTVDAGVAMRRIHQIAAEHGAAANKTFNEMAKNKHISPGVFSLTQIDPRHSDKAESLYAIMRSKDGMEKIKSLYDGRKSDSIDLEDTIKSKLAGLTAAVKRSDISGRSLYTVEGLAELMRIGVMSSMAENVNLSVSKAADEWSKVLIEPYKIIDVNGSIAFTKWDTVEQSSFIEDFLRGAHGYWNLQGSANSLENQLVSKKMNSKFVPEPRWVRRAEELGDKNFAKQRLIQRLNEVEFVMNPSYDGLIMMHKDTGVRRPFKDSKGKTVEIPFNKIHEFDFRFMTPEETEEQQIKNIMETKFGTGGLF